MTDDEVKREAKRAVHEIAPLFAAAGLGEEHPAMKVVERYLNNALEAENVKCETLATSTGDQHEKSGCAEKAEVAWGVAARIRMRRPKRPF